jgi:hypothetical protein
MRDFWPSLKEVKYIYVWLLYPIIFLFTNNLGQASPIVLVMPLLISFGITTILFALFRFAFKSNLKAGLFTFLLIIVFFSFGHISSSYELYLLKKWSRHGHNLGQVYENVGAISLILICTALFFLIKNKAIKFTNFLHKGFLLNAGLPLNTVALVFAGLSLVNLVSKKDAPQNKTSLSEFDGDTVSKLGYNPDIYFIVLDGYGRQDTLKSVYAHDNEPFLKKMESIGFQVARDSSSNYYWTYLSLASILNMRYINDLTDQLGPTSANRTIPYTMIQDSEVSRFLKARGYSYYHFATSWGATMFNPYADKLVECNSSKFSEEFYRVIFETTLLRVFTSIVSADLADCTLEKITLLKQMPLRDPDKAKFVFNHFILPHHPYLFDEHGNILKRVTISNQFDFQAKLWNDKEKYTGQIKFLNSKVFDLSESIIKKCKNPPIIVIVSDHGPQIGGFEKNQEAVDHHRLSNLAMVYYPPQMRPALAARSGGVNYFRDIFRHFFNAPLEPLPVQRYRSTSVRPYDFIEVPPLQGR